MTRRALHWLVLACLLAGGFSAILLVPAASTYPVILQTVLSEDVFLAAGTDAYGAALDQSLRDAGFFAGDAVTEIGGTAYTLGNLVWHASQRRDYAVSPKMLLALLQTEGALETLSGDALMPYAQNAVDELWQAYADHQNGARTFHLANGDLAGVVESVNAPTYALAARLAARCENLDCLRTALDDWSDTYQAFYGQDPLDEPLRGLAMPNVAPFLRLPFDQPSNNFLKVNSFLDHASPGIYDDSLLRFDGASIGNASFSNCTIAVSCYGGHNGIDYSTGAGRAMLAAAAGTVVYKYYNTDSGAGTVDSGLIIDHGNGYRTSYWHMDPIAVNYGDAITKGQIIGLSGNIGMSSGAHLHFGLRITASNKSVDPYGWWASTSDPWGESQFNWEGDLTADNSEAQAQLFYRSYWYRDTAGYNGESYWTNSVTTTGASTNWAIYGANLPSPGRYDVYAYWHKTADNTQSARYKVFHRDGIATVTVNQAADGDRFVLLGTYDFNLGRAAVIQTDLASDSMKRVYFDAIRWSLHSDHAPTDIQLSPALVAENLPIGSTIGTLTTSDPDTGDTHIYTLVSGVGSDDNASFTISSSSLRTNAVFDFEQRAAFTIRVRSTDTSGQFVEEAFAVSISNINEAPTLVSLPNSTLPEGLLAGTTVGTLGALDPDSGDSHSFTLVSGSGSGDNALFSIAGSSLRTAAALDHESQPTRSIRVRATDSGGLILEQVFTITVQDVNEPPDSIALEDSSIAENQPPGSSVGILDVQDADAGDIHSFTMVSGSGDADNSLFNLDGAILRANSTFDFESRASYTIRVRATDSGGLWVEQVFMITIANVNEAPGAILLSANAMDENLPPGSIIASLSTFDPDVGDNHAFSLVPGEGSADNSQFIIDDSNLLISASPNHENQPVYAIRVRVTDAGGLFHEQAFMLAVNDLPEPPFALALTPNHIAENLLPGAFVGALSAQDEDQPEIFTFELADGEGSQDNSLFLLDGSLLTAVGSLDHEAAPLRFVRLRVTDSGGLWLEQALTITILDRNDPPTAILAQPGEIDENQPPGTPAAVLTAADQDLGDSHTFTLVAGAGDDDNHRFEINAGNELRALASLDFEATPALSVRVRVSDDDGGGVSLEQVLVIAVNNLFEHPPTALTLAHDSLGENQSPGTLVGRLLVADLDAGEPHTFSLVPGYGSDHNALFNIEEDQLLSNQVFDYERQSTLSVRVRVTDTLGYAHEETFHIYIDDWLERWLPFAIR